MAKKVLEIMETEGPRQAGAAGLSGLTAHTLALARAGADVHLLLRGNAVRCGQSDGRDGDIASLVQRGADVYYVEEDARARCIAADQLLAGLKPVRSDELPALLHGYDQIWRW